MLKKILLWTLYIFFVGGLVWAGYNRTSVTLGERTTNQSHGNASETSQEADTASVWAIYQGEITALTQRKISITIETGSTITLNPRPWRFALEQGFQASLGDRLLVTCIHEVGKLEVVHLRNLENESVAQIRDEAGHPLWESRNNSKE